MSKELEHIAELLMQSENLEASVYMLKEFKQAYADKIINSVDIDKIIEDGKWGFPEDEAGHFMVRQLKEFWEQVIEQLKTK